MAYKKKVLLAAGQAFNSTSDTTDQGSICPILSQERVKYQP